jgi:hypothetical protein
MSARNTVDKQKKIVKNRGIKNRLKKKEIKKKKKS